MQAKIKTVKKPPQRKPAKAKKAFRLWAVVGYEDGALNIKFTEKDAKNVQYIAKVFYGEKLKIRRCTVTLD
jgi:hypothetical protein